jgi:hypothetical protein
MGKATVILGFVLIGYGLGFFSFLVWSVSAYWVIALFPNWLPQDMIGGTIIGIAGAIIMVLGVLIWSRLSS